MDPIAAKTPVNVPERHALSEAGKTQSSKRFSDVIAGKQKDLNVQQGRDLIGTNPTPEAIDRNNTAHLGAGFRHTIEHLQNSQIRLDTLLEKLQAGHPISESEMITIQSILLSTSREIETVAKMVEQFVSGVKTTMQMQV